MRDYVAQVFLFFLILFLTVSLTDQIQLLYNYGNMFNQRTKGDFLVGCVNLGFYINFEREYLLLVCSGKTVL